MIRRSPRPTTGWTTFSNDVLSDRELSFRALGILVYVLSKPDNWVVRSEQLAESHAEGRDAVRTALEHLELAGYVKRDKVQDRRGRWVTETVFYDRPFDRNLDDCTTEAGFPGVGSPVVGEPGAITSTEEQGLRARSTPRRRSATASTGRKRGLAEPDETPDDNGEPPAHGATGPASPKRKTQAEADVVAADRGTSGRGLAVRLRDGLDTTDLPTSAKVVDVGLLARRLNELNRKGMPRDVQAKCVELYVASPSRYKLGDSKGWTGFLEALPKLEADAAGHVRVEQGGARFGGAYAGVIE